uniref:Uncharacterized protein n=1 Tax=Mucochytrium quahogii TaxID=96639 RepID=A0A7S2S1H4_9STRA|mmetsp:Transcript_37360/g.60781  ORF Transcript_37360/g.60781 Transcript_37360/m.60781 type:complete len:297 (+) Transcript_37360:2944-3834(+)|eukprot:CAMPEP_0203757112 /NCGR_PEP_ID=MMETSP0098-20131031/10258_1 /ASSEMBLY_ACC=CAM_ASM_000208 /TAXON_ID=96639 /ORGANISM=" , Strain NY0313808BC1" /LENGTH=296 /DNA_ID=CAMNT_0050649233 /DNA_START=2448 /DNA_END=3338 /DNA_ORIENTATION=+
MSYVPRSLTELHQIKQAVRTLQRNAKEQIVLEQEAQANFEQLNGQVAALRAAFNTLSDVVMDEVDSVRGESDNGRKILEKRLDQYAKENKEIKTELDLMKRNNELWTSKERDWAKDNELLKVSHAHVANWIQQLQRDIMDAREQVNLVKQEHSSRTLQLSEEANTLRTSWKSNVETLQTRLGDYEDLLQRTQMELHNVVQARMDDLELMERAINTVREQQVRLRASVDENLGTVSSDIKVISRRADQTDTLLTQAKMNISDLQKAIDDHKHLVKNRLQVIDRLVSTSTQAGGLEHS